MKYRLRDREKRLFSILAIVVCLYVVLMWGIEPAMERRRILDERIHIEGLRLRKMRALLQSESPIEEISLNPIEMPTLIKELSKMARQSGLIVDCLISSENRRIELILQGDMNGVANLVHRIEGSEYMIGVRSIAINPKIDDPRILNTHLTLEYLEKEVPK